MDTIVPAADTEIEHSPGAAARSLTLRPARRPRRSTFYDLTFKELETWLVDQGEPAFRAKQLGLLLPQKASPGATHKQTGLAIRSGILQFQVVGLDATEYALACFFLGEPDTPLDPRQITTRPRNLLQPFQLVGQLHFALQKDPALGNLYGELLVQKV